MQKLLKNKMEKEWEKKTKYHFRELIPSHSHFHLSKKKEEKKKRRWNKKRKLLKKKLNL